MQAVILAGGRGMRLRPYTDRTPKPLLPLDGIPILEILIRQLVDAGCTNVTLALAWMADAIQAHFGDGRWLGADIDYSVSAHALGTAGPLALLAPPPAPCLVANADILTTLDFRALLEFHRPDRLATVVTQQRDLELRYGVIDVSADGRLVGVSEKPPLTVRINTGIYVLDPDAWEHLTPGERVEMPDLLQRLARSGHALDTYELPPGASWTDIGVPEDYLRAEAAFRAERARYLPPEPASVSERPASERPALGSLSAELELG